MKIHQIKILKGFADAIVEGRKTFEVRKNDRGYHVGDLVKFTAVDCDARPYNSHEINTKTYVITYILSGWGIKEEYVVFSIAPYKKEEEET